MLLKIQKEMHILGAFLNLGWHIADNIDNNSKVGIYKKFQDWNLSKIPRLEFVVDVENFKVTFDRCFGITLTKLWIPC